MGLDKYSELKDWLVGCKPPEPDTDEEFACLSLIQATLDRIADIEEEEEKYGL